MIVVLIHAPRACARRWDLATPILGIPFLEALIMFVSFANYMYTFFFFFGELVDRTSGSLGAYRVLMLAVSLAVGTAVFLFGWDNMAKKFLYYKLLRRGVVIDFANYPIWYSGVVWGIFTMALCSLAFLRNGDASFEMVYPMISMVIFMVMRYMPVFLTENYLIPFNIVMESDPKDPEHAPVVKDWICGCVVVEEENFRNYLKALVKNSDEEGVPLQPKVHYDRMAAALHANPKGVGWSDSDVAPWKNKLLYLWFLVNDKVAGKGFWYNFYGTAAVKVLVWMYGIYQAF
eukprot:jgi/Mesvir1/27368/Mv07178-RA.3